MLEAAGIVIPHKGHQAPKKREMRYKHIEGAGKGRETETKRQAETEIESLRAALGTQAFLFGLGASLAAGE